MILRHIISLSTIPPRFGKIGKTLDALLAQNSRAEEIRLYIPRHYRRFPDYDGTLPEVPAGVSIHRVEEDIGPATKVLFADRDLAKEDIRILYCDDDKLYCPDWSQRLLAAAQRHPDAAITGNGFDLPRLGLSDLPPPKLPRVRPLGKALDIPFHLKKIGVRLAYGGRNSVPEEKQAVRRIVWRSGYADIAEGFAGVVIRAGSFDAEAWNIPPAIWAVDDIWLSGHLARAGIPIWVEAGAGRYPSQGAEMTGALCLATIEGLKRDDANVQCALYLRERYGIWQKTPNAAQLT